MKISLAAQTRRVRAEGKIHALHAKARKKLPTDKSKLTIEGGKHMQELSRQHSGKTFRATVVKAWLYDKGFDETEARTILWYCAARGIIRFSVDFNIECGEFESFDD